MPLLLSTPRVSRLAEDLARLAALPRERSLPLSDLAGGGTERGFALALLLVTLPFVLPFPTLGMSTPVGLAVAVAAASLILGRKASLPPGLGTLEVRPWLLAKLLTALSRATALAAPFVRPRLGILVSGTPMRSVLGVSLLVSAVVLALPVPLPLSNFFPAAAILLLAAGMIEDDGLLVLAGHFACAAVCAVVYGSWALVMALGERALLVIAE